jgi:hypothetical protein
MVRCAFPQPVNVAFQKLRFEVGKCHGRIDQPRSLAAAAGASHFLAKAISCVPFQCACLPDIPRDRCNPLKGDTACNGPHCLTICSQASFFSTARRCNVCVRYIRILHLTSVSAQVYVPDKDAPPPGRCGKQKMIRKTILQDLSM